MARIGIGVQESNSKKVTSETVKTHWFNLVFWNGKTELLDGTIAKGSIVTIEGKLVTNNYKDKKGEMKYTTEIVVNDLSLGSLI